MDEPSTNKAAALQPALAEMAQWSGVGCEHWLQPRHGLLPAHLVELGLAAPISRNVPLCQAHGCALLQSCPHRADFEQRVAGIGSKKCRLSDAGRRVIQQGLDAQLPHIMQHWPLATRVQETLAQAGGHLSIFELTWRLVEPEVQALLGEQETGQAVDTGLRAPARSELKLALDLLARLGVIAWRADGQAVTLVQDVPLHVER